MLCPGMLDATRRMRFSNLVADGVNAVVATTISGEGSFGKEGGRIAMQEDGEEENQIFSEYFTLEELPREHEQALTRAPRSN